MVVGGEEGAAADGVVQVLGDGPGDGEAVEGAGAAADLVEDDSERSVAWLRMMAVSLISTMKVDWPRGEVVGGADAGEDAVDEAERGATRPGRRRRSGPSATISAIWRM